MPSLPEILAPAAIQDRVNRVKVNNTRLQRLFQSGFTANVPSELVRDKGGRNAVWDIYDDIREVADGSIPGTAPQLAARRPVGQVRVTYPRNHQSIPLLYEQIHNLRAIGGPSLDIDRNGVRTIEDEIQTSVQRITNAREAQLGGMIRGAMYYSFSGNRLVPSYTSGDLTIDWQVPAGNKSTLDMLGTGAIIDAVWSTAGTDIPKHLYAIDAAFQKLHGRRLRNVLVDGTTWNWVQSNTAVRNLAGSANRVFETLEQTPDDEADFVAVLAGIPWIKWHVLNSSLSINGTDTPVVPAARAVFLPAIERTWYEYWNGSEPVVTPENMRFLGEQFGAFFYAHPTAHPAGYALVNLHNGIPCLRVPKALAIGTVG